MPRSSRRLGGWRTRGDAGARGEYRHPMPVGVRTAAGWTVVRGDPAQDPQVVVIETRDRPDAVWLDPFGATDVASPEQHRLSVQ